MSHSAEIQKTKTELRNPSKPNNSADNIFVVVSIILTLLAGVNLLGLTAVQLLWVPACIEVFQDFDTQLPRPTYALLSVPSVLIVSIYLLIAITLIAKEFLRAINPKVKCAISLLVLLISITMAFAYAISLYLPMVSLHDSLM